MLGDFLKRFRVLTLTVGSLGLMAAPVTAGPPEPHHGPAAHPLSGPGIELPAEAREVSVPFRLVNHHIILLGATVNGSDPLRILLDTGMPMEALGLYDTPKTEALHLPFRDDVHARVGGVGGKGKSHPVQVATGLVLRIGDLRLLNAGALLFPPMPGLAAYSDGVIGAALFRHLAVTVDNDRSVLILRRPEAYQPPAGATIVPLVEGEPAPTVEATVRVGDSKPVTVRLAVDLGATHALSLNESDKSGISAPATTITTRIGRGLSGPLDGKVGRIQALELGGLTLREVVTTFPAAEYRKQPGISMADGNLGNGTLERFNFTVDYAGKRLVLQPAHRLDEPFEWDMSGMVADIGGEGEVRIEEVLGGSPASEAGIRKDDVILRIADQPVDAETYFVLREKLRRDGETVAVDLRRGGKPLKVSIKLRRLV